MAGINEPAKKAETFLDKFQHPFVASFISSWIISNWDIFYALLGGWKDPFDTITKIKNQYPFWENIGHLIFFPLGGMLAYVYFGPKLLNWYLLYKHKEEVKRRFEEEVTNGTRPIKQSEYVQLQADRMKDLRENSDLRAVIGIQRSFPMSFPGDGNATNYTFEQYVKRTRDLYDEKVRLEEEVLELKKRVIEKTSIE